MTEHEKRKSLRRIAVEALVRTPRRLKVGLLLNVALFSGIAVMEVVDAFTGGPASPTRTAALVLLLLGALVLSVASVLYTASQRDADCSLFAVKMQAFRVRTRKLDEVLVAFPPLIFVAGCLVAAGLGIFMPSARSPWAVGLLLGMGVWFLVWGALMLASTSRFLYTEAREQAEAAERARSEAVESQLAALQAQMNPHFLFNTLNTVASLIRTDPVAAETTVENLSVVLRRTLERSQRVLSTVDDEVDHLAAYLSVAKQRFGDRLHVHWDIDPAARDLMLPTMTLQPLVENALKHGIGARLEGGAVHVGAHLERRQGGTSAAGEQTGSVASLVLEVADDGPGFPRRYEEGTGLQNLRERLATLYGDEGELRVEKSDPGTRVVVSVPAVAAPEKILDAAFKRGATVDDVGEAAAPVMEDLVTQIKSTVRAIAHNTAREVRDSLDEAFEDLRADGSTKTRRRRGARVREDDR